MKQINPPKIKCPHNCSKESTTRRLDTHLSL